MNDELIEDLKQFIAATVSQATADMAMKDDLQNLVTKADLQHLAATMESRFDELTVKVDTIADAHAETLEDHDQRLGRLEQRAA
jgi:hypothetical protein